jgi:hypothetical protein
MRRKATIILLNRLTLKKKELQNQLKGKRKRHMCDSQIKTII